ncbi:hypothetical protein DFH06DRAFT_986592 [Mycena polygramma]|nr:hypothetical protein DFH06DRAFT_986592 [Mycena polygramma]
MPKPSGSGERLVPVLASSSVRPKKERERARAPTEYAQRLHAPVDAPSARKIEESKQVIAVDAYCGPAEYELMRREMEALKKAVLDGKKQLKKQNKTISELKAQVVSETLAREAQERLVATASSKSRKSEELLQTIESSLQCQICIELVSKPNVLAPCGHVFCLECLQQWFRSAPGESDGEMDMDTQEQYILHREKSCPCCRATVLRRPVPVFVVKSVVTALRNAAAAPAAAAQADEDADPWKGLFLPDYQSSDNENVDGYDSSEDDGEFFDHYSDQELEDLDEVALAIGLGGFEQQFTRFYASASESEEDGFGSDSDEEQGEEEEEDSDIDIDTTYSFARWEPPRHVVRSELVSHSVRRLLRRGCTPQLIALFNMRYTHDEGLVAYVSSLEVTHYDDVSVGLNRLYLGWNIDIVQSDEEGAGEGEAEKMYITHQLRDIRWHPERWMVSERPGFPGRGVMDARRLAPVVEDAEDYDNSESEAYSNGEEFMQHI